MKKIDLQGVSDLERGFVRRGAVKMIQRGDKKKEVALFYGVHVNTVRD